MNTMEYFLNYPDIRSMFKNEYPNELNMIDQILNKDRTRKQ